MVHQQVLSWDRNSYSPDLCTQWGRPWLENESAHRVGGLPNGICLLLGSRSVTSRLHRSPLRRSKWPTQRRFEFSMHRSECTRRYSPSRSELRKASSCFHLQKASFQCAMSRLRRRSCCLLVKLGINCAKQSRQYRRTVDCDNGFRIFYLWSNSSMCTTVGGHEWTYLWCGINDKPYPSSFPTSWV